ncbi:MAG TPA: hypothetical protein VLD16_04665 [Gaiellaceae bacterium]|nr:hypothetical protein [Gaiellaceae bacterium]
MVGDEEVWIPLVDEPIGTIVAQVQEEHPEIGELVSSPQQLLAFRTFAYIRVGILLGRLLVEHHVEDVEGATWAEQLANDPRHREAVAAEILAVAREVAENDSPADPLGPSDEERARFSAFARSRLAADT